MTFCRLSFIIIFPPLRRIQKLPISRSCRMASMLFQSINQGLEEDFHQALVSILTERDIVQEEKWPNQDPYLPKKDVEEFV